MFGRLYDILTKSWTMPWEGVDGAAKVLPTQSITVGTVAQRDALAATLDATDIGLLFATTDSSPANVLWAWQSTASGLAFDYAQKYVSGAAMVYETGLGAGERHPDSATLGHQVTTGERNATIISVTTAVTIGGGVASDTLLHGFRILANFTGDLVIAGFEDEAGNAVSMTFTTPTAGWYDMGDIINSKGALTFTAANVADDNKCVAVWRTK